MSLLSWYPFNGDTRDYGTLGNQPSVSGISYTNGKIGQCLSSGYISLSAEQTEKLFHKTTSISFWLYTKKGSGEGNNIIGNQTMGSGNNRKFSTWIYSYASESILHCSWQQDNTPNSETYISTWLSMPIEQWNHIVLIQDEENNKITFYVNGEVVFNDSPNPTLKNRTITYKNATTLCTASSYNFLNDFRVYDHALSQAEVKELSKALVIHYTFNDVLAEPTTNYSNPSQWSIYPAYWTLVTNTDSGFKIKKTSGNTETTVAFSNGVIYEQMAVGEIWTTTCYLYKNGQPYKSSTDALTNYGLGISVLNFESRDDGYYNSTFKINSKSNAYLMHARIFGDTVSESDIYEIKFLQFEKKDHATPYTPGSRSSLLYNETGLLQPSTKNNILLSTDSGIGTCSLNCQGNTEIIMPNACDISQGVTISFWVKCSIPTDSRLIFADSNSKTAFGFFNNGQAIITCAGYGHACVSNIRTNWKSDWNHIIVQRNSSGNVSCYLNNNKLTLSGSQEWTHSATDTLSIGCRYSGGWTSYFSGLIDDFRFYATCLSVDDIKDLYQTKAYISDKGDICCGEFIEGKTQAQVTSKGTFEANEFYEEIDEGYEVLEYIENASANNLQGPTPSIDTGIIPKLPFKAVAEITTVNTAASNEDGVLLGVSSNGSFIPFYIYQGKWHSDDLGVRIGDAPNNTYFKAEYEATSSQRITTINGVQNVYTGTKTLPNASLWVMNGHWVGSQLNRGANVKLHNLMIVNAGKLERYYIPVRQKSTGKVGLYDCVYKVFYEENSGSSIPFTAGSTLTNSNASIYDNQNVSGRNIIEI